VRWPLWRVAVVERSMEPTFWPGDWLLVRGSPRGSQQLRIRTGQVVVARHPAEPDLLLVKRAVRQLADGSWWLQSDNAGVGEADSARFGAVPPALIEGRVVGRYRRARR
jgi:nickel-type superoxide dismutase maturation protease